MLRQFLDRALGARRTGDQMSDDAPDDRDGSSRKVEASTPSETSDVSKDVAASREVASADPPAPTKYPLSWPARDLARTRRLQSQETTMRSRGRKSGSAEEPDSDPTTVWRPTDGSNG